MITSLPLVRSFMFSIFFAELQRAKYLWRTLLAIFFYFMDECAMKNSSLRRRGKKTIILKANIPSDDFTRLPFRCSSIILNIVRHEMYTLQQQEQLRCSISIFMIPALATKQWMQLTNFFFMNVRVTFFCVTQCSLYNGYKNPPTQPANQSTLSN